MTIFGQDVNTRAGGRLDLGLLTIFPSWGPEYFVANHTAITSRGNTYRSIGLNLTRPQRDGRPGRAEIAVPVVGESLVNALRGMRRAVDAMIEIVWDDDPDTVVEVIDGLQVTAGRIQGGALTCTLTRYWPQRAQVGRTRVTQDRFPGAYNGI